MSEQFYEFDSHSMIEFHREYAVDRDAASKALRSKTPVPVASSPQFEGNTTVNAHVAAAFDAAGHTMCDDHAPGAGGNQLDDQACRGSHTIPVIDGEGVHSYRDFQTSAVAPAEIIEEIREQWRRRQNWHRAEKALTLQAKALCRRLAANGDKDEADVIYKAALGKGEHLLADIAFAAIFPLTEARDGVEKHRLLVEKRLEKLAAQLPVAGWVKTIRGVGMKSLASVVGEAGDLGAYSNPGKLWKRMGLAPHDGKAYATWRSKGGLTSADWELAGYRPSRRSVAWNIGACILKAGGPLKQVYGERKAYELARGLSKLHAHNRAQRYAEKRFLLLLWKAWRANPEQANG